MTSERGVFKLLTDDQLEDIYAAALRVIDRVGLIIRSERALRLMADAGAHVDFTEQRVRIPRGLAEEGVKRIPKNITLYARKPERDLSLVEGRVYTRISANCIRIIDLETGKCRDALAKDQEDLLRLYDALDNIDIVSYPLAPSDLPAEIRDIYGVESVFRNTRKHLHCPAYANANLGYTIRLASVVAGGDDELRRRPIMSYFATAERGLYYGEVAEMIIKAAEYNLPICILSTIVAGGTSPITLAGTLVQSVAEFLCGNLLAQLTNPSNPMLYSTAPVNMDMTTGAPILGSIEFGMGLVGIIQMARYMGVPSVVYGFGTDSKTLDEQAAFEKAFLLTLSALAGGNIIYGPGVLESDLTQSFEQTVIDCELLDIVRRLLRGITVDEETLAEGIIAKVGPGGHHLKEEYTRKHFRREYYLPELCNRATREIWEKLGSKDIIQVAREKAKKILLEHRAPQLDREIMEEMRVIVREAEETLVKKP